MFNEKVNKLVELVEKGILTEKEMLEAVRLISKDVKEHVFSQFNKGLSYELVYRNGTLGYEVSQGSCDDCYFVTIDNTYRSLPVIGIAEDGFAYCSDLREIEFPNTLLYIGDRAFSGCFNLREASLTNTELLKIGDEAFHGCESLLRLEWPKTLTYIGECAYFGCESLGAIIVLGNVKTLSSSLFRRCYNISSIWLDYSKIETIEDDVFFECHNVEKIHFPRTLKEIKSCAFAGCKNLSKIVYEGNYDDWLKIKKSEDWNQDTPSCTLKCNDYETTIDEGNAYVYTEQWLKDRLKCNPPQITKEQIIKNYLDNN